MGKPATRDEVLEQIRGMALEDREYIEAELLREGCQAGRRSESPAAVAELVGRANDALAHPDRAISREESIARARAAIVTSRSRKS